MGEKLEMDGGRGGERDGEARFVLMKEGGTSLEKKCVCECARVCVCVKGVTR